MESNRNVLLQQVIIKYGLCKVDLKSVVSEQWSLKAVVPNTGLTVFSE